jgi:hypothetical protein
MKTLTLILTALGIASANADHHHKGKPHVDWKAKKEEFLKKFDKNKNGKIDPEERKAIAEEWRKKRGRKPRPHGRHKAHGRKKPQRGQ